MKKMKFNKKKEGTDKVKIRKPNLSTICYIIAVSLFVVAIYTAVINIIYLINYATSYGVSLISMWQDVVSYVISGFVPYFSYAFIIFILGKIIKNLFEIKDESDDEQEILNEEACEETGPEDLLEMI